MAWVAPAIMAATAVYGATQNSGGKGAASSTPSSMWQNMPADLQAKFQQQMAGMPSTTNVSFGGNTYPSTYGPMMRSAKSLFAPAGQNMTGPSTSSLAGGMAASAPWMWMMANNRGMTGTGLQGGGSSLGTYGMMDYPMQGYSDPYAGYMDGGGMQ